MSRSLRLQIYLLVILAIAAIGLVNYEIAARRKQDDISRSACISKVVTLLKSSAAGSREPAAEIVRQAFAGTSCVASQADLQILTRQDHLEYRLKYRGRAVSGSLSRTADGHARSFSPADSVTSFFRGYDPVWRIEESCGDIFSAPDFRGEVGLLITWSSFFETSWIGPLGDR